MFFFLHSSRERTELRYQANNICIFFFRISQPSPAFYMYDEFIFVHIHDAYLYMCVFEVNICWFRWCSTLPHPRIPSPPLLPTKSPFALDIYFGMWLCGASITHNTALTEFGKFLIHPKKYTGNPSTLQTLKRFTPIFERVIDHVRRYKLRGYIYMSRLTHTENVRHFHISHVLSVISAAPSHLP